MTVSLLLEHTDDLLKKLYQQLQDPRPTRLFDKTELSFCREKSPLWLDAANSVGLLDTLHKTPDAWPGLIIESAQTDDVLLAHLRRLLIVNFDGKRRGVLRYSNPVTASYLLTAEVTQENPQWWGPISRLSWYGGTWAEHAEGEQRWNHLENTHACAWTPQVQQVTPRLSDAQEDSLRLQELERFAYAWWKKQTFIPFPKALDYLNEGLTHGFGSEPELMNRYLSLRAQYPEHKSPQTQLTGNGENRLETLHQWLQQPCGKKETAS